MTSTCHIACWLIVVCGGAGGGGTMAAVGRRRPPWLGCVFLASFRLANCVSDVPQPQNHQKTTTVRPDVSINNGWMGTFEVPILCACMGGRRLCQMNE